ncbi:hypothetical protein CPB97_006737, partial [Podila verticillata]
VVVAQMIPSGMYVIEDVNSGKFLGIGPTPLVYPLPDVPVRLFQRGHPFVERWLVEGAEDGAVIISAAGNSPKGYKIVTKEDAVFVSTQKEPQLLAVEPAGMGEVVIKLPNEDRVFTSLLYSSPDKLPEIFLQPAEGLPNQRYRFLRIDRDLYRSNRFNVQESC